MLNDSNYFQAVLQTLSRVKEMNQAQIELGMANESIASKSSIGTMIVDSSLIQAVEQNLELQEQLYQLRAETKEAFEEAKSLEARWRDLEREQRDAYQVR